MKALLTRTLQAIVSFLIAFDILVQTIIKTPIWVLFNRARPSSRETISATLGWGAAHGYKWAAFLAGLVDDVFGQGHCAKAYREEQAYEFPI